MFWVMVMSVVALVEAREPVSCEDARLKCAYREGCGMALQNYIVGCSAVLQGPPLDYCPEICQHSLIALTSTEEGKDLMNCECNDEFCSEAKDRVEICRPEVSRIMDGPDETVVSCRVAQWICAADTYCSTALQYYNRYCRSMFHGKKCTHRCHNSINILRRQEKAAKLKTCQCDGREDYDCPSIQRNMDKLCFHKNSNAATTTSTTQHQNHRPVRPSHRPTVVEHNPHGKINNNNHNNNNNNEEDNDIVPALHHRSVAVTTSGGTAGVSVSVLIVSVWTVAGVLYLNT